MSENAPQRIWAGQPLGNYDIPTWGQTKLYDTDTEYVRADLREHAAEKEALEAALARTEANRDAAMQDAQEEYQRAEAAKARAVRLEKALAIQKKAAQDYCWQRYKDRPPMNLRSPAVFTSHEWQKIGEAMDAALTQEDRT